MNRTIVSTAKSTHYTVSTFAAVAYAIVWLLANQADAETPTAQPITEIVITAKRELPEIVVWGTRETATPTSMDEIVVYGHRQNSDDTRVAATHANVFGTAIQASGAWTFKARHWLRAVLLK